MFALVCLLECNLVFLFLLSPFRFDLLSFIVYLHVLPFVCLTVPPPTHLSICHLSGSTRTTPPWPSWSRTNWTPTRLMTQLWERWARENLIFLSLYILASVCFVFFLWSHTIVAKYFFSLSLTVELYITENVLQIDYMYIYNALYVVAPCIHVCVFLSL